MTYKIDQCVAKITSHVLLIYDGYEKIFDNGKQLADADFDKYYLVDSISIKDDMIAVTLKENDRINDTNCAAKSRCHLIN